VCPLERVGQSLVEMVNKGQNPLLEFLYRGETMTSSFFFTLAKSEHSGHGFASVQELV